MSVAHVLIGAPAAPRPAWLPAAAALLADSPAADVLAWAVETFGSGLTVACSMQDGVLVDLAARADPDVEVVFLDTGFHFGETLTTARRMKARYDLNLVTLRPRSAAETYDVDGTGACCAARKVAPLERHLAGRSAWVTGLRRAESSSRAEARTVEWDAGRGIVKINPIVAWSDDEVERYIAEHDVIVNPLRDKGFASIGCAPCTVAGSGRDGRWTGDDRLECGLHLVTGGG
ncbi:MAG TPA: phosphoadenylyl-sulfate reductase [Acidimicrobiia bacterium]|nr:phosphoadenylyl-sulfate reductase [Acidimicrobiia bacterium]